MFVIREHNRLVDSCRQAAGNYRPAACAPQKDLRSPFIVIPREIEASLIHARDDSRLDEQRRERVASARLIRAEWHEQIERKKS